MVKNIYYDKIWQRYRIQKVINHKKISYGTYATEKEATQVVTELIKNEWDKNKLPIILEELNINSKIIKK